MTTLLSTEYNEEYAFIAHRTCARTNMRLHLCIHAERLACCVQTPYYR